MNTELKEAEKVIDNSFEQYWNSIMDCVCNYLKLSDDNILGLRCHVSEIEHDEFAKPIYDLIDRTPSPSGETDNDDVAKHFKKLKVTDIPENHKPYYNGYNDGIEDCIIALSAHNQFAGDGWISKEKVDELLELQKEDIKAWLHRRARDFGGISYHQIDEFIDDYQIVQCHKNENDGKAI